MDNLRWLVLRDVAVFPPPCHTLIVCQRDMTLEVIEGRIERRHEFVIDHFSGKRFGRIGTGCYKKWSPVPPVGMMLSPLKNPEPNKMVVVGVTIPQYFGLKIGRMTYNGMWEIFSETLNSWVVISVGYIDGWLMLPS